VARLIQPSLKGIAMKKFVLATAAAAIVLSGCAGGMTDTQRNTGIGGNRGAIGTGAVVGAAAGALGGYLWSQRMENQKRQMEAATQGTGVAVTQTPNNELKLAIPSDVSFDVGRANIKPNFAPVLDQFASGLRNNPNAEVRIIGHTDSTGSDAINNPLSVERATSTRDYLVARGVNAAAFRIEGRGSHEPVADNNSDAGRAQNRRVEIYVGERGPRG
jgi:outer membrane protein OmpA-like peptidoglycan-associated protein